MKISKSILVLGIGVICSTTACRKPIEPEPAKTAAQANLGSVESESLLNNTSVQMSADIKDMRNCEGLKKFEAMQNIPDKTGELPIARTSNSDFQSTVATSNSNAVVKLFKEILFSAPVAKVNARHSAEDSTFDFKHNLGTYTYNNAIRGWDEATNTAGTIEINFPTDSTKMNVNDGKLIIYNYAETMVDSEAAPTSMIAKFTVAGSLYASINFAATYNDKHPTLSNMKAYLKPWNFHSEGKDNGGSAVGSYKVFKDNETPITTANVTVTFENGDKEKPLLGTGYFQYRDIKIGGKVMAKEIMDNENAEKEPTELQLNTWVDLDVLRASDNAKLADVYLQMNNEDEPVLIKLNDGTTKLPEVYFENVIKELEDIEREFSNDTTLDKAPMN